MVARRLLAALAFFAVATAPAAAAVRITIVNTNQPGVGFNDPTPATPVGGNPGTTLGDQRLRAFEYAASLWGALLDSDVEIRVQASFEALECTATTGTLGAAAPSRAVSDFPNAPLAGTWYPVALASRIAGQDLAPPGVGHIRARFNSNLGTANCLSGSSWYYGFDNNHGASVDLVAVLLHEFGHGLGFLTLVDRDTGAEFLGHPDVFETHILDTSSGKHWNTMSDDERRVSTVNTGNVLWDGIAVEAAVPGTLADLPVLTVSSPATIAGDLAVGTASFGPALTTGSVSGRVVAALDPSDASGMATTDACSTLTNASAVAGKVALVDRGTCFFVDKARHVQDAGAIALVIVNNVSDTSPLGLGGDDATITIPVVSITQADGNAIRAHLEDGVTVALRLNPRRHAGSGLDNRMHLFAPNPVQTGSSTSHWDTSAVPNLLMEPNLSGDLPHEVDLTLPLFRDIGWASEAVPEPASRAEVSEAVSERDALRTVSPRP